MHPVETNAWTYKSDVELLMWVVPFTVYEDYQMKRFIFALPLMLMLSFHVMADEKSTCAANAGSYLTGEVVSGPTYKSGKQMLNGVELSHTHVSLLADSDKKTYDVAIDNVFATGYKENEKVVPVPLSGIKVGDKLSLCGQLYTSGGPGIHWVHTNCDAIPTADKPNGWVKKIVSGTPSENYESLTTYCSLWQ